MSYFSNITEAVVSIAKGMAVTIRTFLQTPETVEYPDVDVLDPKMPDYPGNLGAVSDRFRGFLTVDTEACIVDSACARACPIGCIQLEGEKGPKTKVQSLIPGGKDMPKARYLTKFDIHLGRCMYCGLCVEVCNTGAIYFTREFRGATENYDELIRHCVSEEEALRVKKVAAEEAEKAEKAAKAKEEKDGEKSEGEEE